MRTRNSAKILSLALRSDYAAPVEKRNLAAISYTKQGRALAEQLLKQDPSAYDAYLAVGVENYLIAIEPAPIWRAGQPLLFKCTACSFN
jgi:hypothetical protein